MKIYLKNFVFSQVTVIFGLAWFALSPQARAVCKQGCDLINANTFLGDDALLNNTTGSENTATGFQALFSNTTGFQNTAIGFNALYSNTTGDWNTATGELALASNTTGLANTANGYVALENNTTGSDNTAIGFQALLSNTTGDNNTATGINALGFNTTGIENTATGALALRVNTTGDYNTATGISALLNNTIGSENTATGYIALLGNTTGINNTATGAEALYGSNTGSNNTAEGYEALFYNAAGSNNIAVGYQAGFYTTGGYNIDIGNTGVAGESKTIRIGSRRHHSKTHIAGIRDVTTGNADAIPVLIDSDGQLGTMSSSRRFKKEIKSMDQTSEAILGLKPVTFHYKSDSKGTPQFGLIAEEVAQVNRDLVVRDENGEIYSVRYEAVNAMLLNEFLKEHRRVQELEANAVRQQKQIDALTAGLHKVNAQLELSKSAPQMVLNDH